MKKIFVLFLAIGMLSSCEAIFVENISNASVTILAPSNGTSVSTGILNFNWTPVDDADKYHLQIATPTFSNASQIVLDTLITTSSFSKNLAIGNYQWRVNASNSEYQTSYTTTSFEVH